LDVQVAALDPQPEHAPDDKKYALLQVKDAVEVQVAVPVVQPVQVPVLAI